MQDEIGIKQKTDEKHALVIKTDSFLLLDEAPEE
jgi:hypothetical protein